MYFYRLNPNELYHHGIKGMKWGVRRYRNYLYHHGVKGMKWGVRRYQDKNGRLTSAGKAHASETRKNAKSNQELGPKMFGKKLTEYDYKLCCKICQIDYDQEAIDAINNVYEYDTKRLNALKQSSDIKSFDDIPRLEKPMSAHDSAQLVNPTFSIMDPGSRSNCTFCTVAMAMREKGYDVKANVTDRGLFFTNIDEMWDTNGKTKSAKASNTEDLIKKLESEGDGAYGALGISWDIGGGHELFWKNENRKLHIYDSQRGDEYDVNEMGKYIIHDETTYSRLDKSEPTELVFAAIKKKGEFFY